MFLAGTMRSGRAVFNITSATYGRATAGGTESAVQFTNAGIVNAKDDGLGGGTWTQISQTGDWSHNKSITASDYEIAVTQTGDTLDVDHDLSDGTWLSLGTSRSWALTNSINETTETAVLTVTIRHATTLVTVASGTITLETENE